MALRRTDLETLFKPVVVALGCELWGIEYFPKGKKSLLRIYVDKPEGVGIEDCERVSRQVSSVLDVEDLIKTEYVLEVSSPGMDRPLFTLEQYQKNIGQWVAVQLRAPLDGRRNVTGVMTGIENEEIILVAEGEEYILPIEAINKANIVPKF